MSRPLPPSERVFVGLTIAVLIAQVGRRNDITMSGVAECRQALRIEPAAGT